MFSEFDAEDFVDVTDDITGDVEEPIDTSDKVDEMLDTMSLDELYELRENLTKGDATDIEDNIPDISDLKPIDEPESSDFSFHWDGGPTHNTDLDEDAEPLPYTKKLTR